MNIGNAQPVIGGGNKNAQGYPVRDDWILNVEYLILTQFILYDMITK